MAAIDNIIAFSRKLPYAESMELLSLVRAYVQEEIDRKKIDILDVQAMIDAKPLYRPIQPAKQESVIGC